MTNKLQKVLETVKDLQRLLVEKLQDDMKNDEVAKSDIDFTRGQLFEVNYILEVIEQIIYE